jgi:predicted double-glycine peptidase
MIKYLFLILLSFPIHVISSSKIFFDKVESYHDLKNKNVVLQKEEFSCGAASVATILKQQFHIRKSENSILKDIFKNSTKEDINRIKNTGLNLSEIKEYLIRQNLNVKAGIIKGKFPVKEFIESKNPIIVHLENSDYTHFTVLTYISNYEAHLSDPSEGNITMPISEFYSVWTGHILYITNDGNHDFPLGSEKDSWMKNTIKSLFH